MVELDHVALAHDQVMIERFPEAGGVAGTRNLAWYDGTAWHQLGGGLADLAEAMVVVDHILYVGGPFTAAGGYPASGMAAWSFINGPPI